MRSTSGGRIKGRPHANPDWTVTGFANLAWLVIKSGQLTLRAIHDCCTLCHWPTPVKFAKVMQNETKDS
jgi:hypothetical protein